MVRDVFVLGFTFLVAMILAILPLPLWAAWARPQWVFLVVIFWVVFAPNHAGVGVAWFVGLLLDLLTGGLLGAHAFIFSISAYLIVRYHPQLKNFPLWQQSLMIFLLAMLNLALEYWIKSLSGWRPVNWAFWWPAISSAIIWPWLNMILREYKARFSVA